MQLFDFPYHKFRTEYPESGNRVQLGGNYVFTAPPNGPDLRRITLKFETMKYYLDIDGGIDLSPTPQINMAVLEAFYNFHKLHKSFIYPHPVYGNMEVKFFSPLKIPEGITNGGGALGDFEIELVEIDQ